MWIKGWLNEIERLHKVGGTNVLNVCTAPESGSRFRATGGLLVAEAVEEVEAERFFATIVLASRA